MAVDTLSNPGGRGLGHGLFGRLDSDRYLTPSPPSRTSAGAMAAARLAVIADTAVRVPR